MNKKETREKVQKGVKEYWSDPENRKKHSVNRKEHFNQPEMKEKLSKAQKKRFENPEHLENHRAMIRGLRKPVLCVTTGVIYESQAAAAKDLGICQGGISQIVRGVGKTYKGYVFKLVEPCN